MTKIVLITGASRGIGAEIARLFAENNFTVIVNYSKNEDRALETLSELNSISKLDHCSFKADLTNEADIKKMFSFVLEKFGRLDLLINNAGTTQFIKHDDLDSLSSSLFDQLYQLNLRAAFLCAKFAKKLMENCEDPQIINISSIAATTANGSNIAYCALKAGLVNMTQSLARALAPKIRVNSISPGLTDTELTKDWFDYRADSIAKTPLKRLGTGREIAQVALALDRDMKFITGQDIIVDGGRVLSL